MLLEASETSRGRSDGTLCSELLIPETRIRGFLMRHKLLKCGWLSSHWSGVRFPDRTLNGTADPKAVVNF